MALRFTTVVYLPPDYSATVEAFQRAHTAWSARPTKIAPHVTVKVGGALDDQPAIIAALATVARATPPFAIHLAAPVATTHSLSFAVESPGLARLYHAVEEAIAACTGGERPGGAFRAHVTLLYPTAESATRLAAMGAAAHAALAPFPTFTATTMAMLRLDREDARFVPVRDFPLG